MRPWISIIVCGVMVAAAGVACGQEMQVHGDTQREPFILESWTMDGGGGLVTGGPYELLTTIGQPEAGVAVGEDYVLMSGFLPGGDLGILFAGGFESGNTDRWSITVGGGLR